MMKRLVFGMAFLLVACGGPATVDAGAVETAVALTLAAQPTATVELTVTPSPVPLAEISLEALAIVDGDLPPSVQPSIVMDEPSMYKPFEVFPEAAQFFLQELAVEGADEAGQVAIALYDDPATAGQVYEALVGHAYFVDDGRNTPLELDGTGERGMARFEANIFGDWFRLAFVRCGAVVYVAVPVLDMTDNRFVQNYAGRLDGRLIEAVCP